MSYADLAAPVEAAMRATRPQVLAAYRSTPGRTRFKEDGSPVTDLDTALESQLGETLMALDADFGLRGEESGWMREGTTAWHLDPLDGTANFARRIAVFGSQVVLMEGDEPVFAAVYEPLTDVFTWAAAGAGTWHEGERVRVPDREPKHAVVTVDVARSGLFRERPELIATIRSGCYKVRALGSVAVQLRDVAIGASEGFLGGRVSISPIHDLAPGTLLIREAGGIVSDGRGADALLERKRVVAAAPAVHEWLCGLLG